MPTIRRTVPTRWDPASVFAYLLDFANAEEWDSGTVRCTRLAGDGGLGTRYLNVSRFLGRETELTYELTALEPPTRFVLTGGNGTVTSTDTVTVTALGAGSQVDYHARLDFHGVAGLVAPLLAPALKKLGDDTARRLRETLDRRAGAA